MRIIDIERDAIYMKKKTDKTFHSINPCGIKRNVFSPSWKDGRKPCQRCKDQKTRWIFRFDDRSQIDVGSDNIECSCASGTVECDHLNFLFNKVLKLKELGESLYDYGDLDEHSWKLVEEQLHSLFRNPTTTTCSACFGDLDGINNIFRCNHIHKACMDITKRCYRCEHTSTP